MGKENFQKEERMFRKARVWYLENWVNDGHHLNRVRTVGRAAVCSRESDLRRAGWPQNVQARSGARELIGNMEQNIRFIERKARFADDLERDEALIVYRDGIATLQRRLGQ